MAAPQEKQHYHGPENAEHELRKAYNTVIETGVTHFWDRRPIAGVNADEVAATYRHAFRCHRDGDRLAAERWARTTKHLARALWHEAKLAWFEDRLSELPFLEGAEPEEYGLHERADTTADLLTSLERTLPPGFKQMPAEMTRYLSRARRHLEALHKPSAKNELVHAEHIKAAHEYGRAVECMALAYEAEAQKKPPSPKKVA